MDEDEYKVCWHYDFVFSINPKIRKVYGVALNSKDAWMIVDGGVDLLLGIPNDSIHHQLELIVFLS